MESFETIAQILKTDKDIIKNVAAYAERFSGKINVPDTLVAHMQNAVQATCRALAIPQDAGSKQVWDSLEQKVAQHETLLRAAIGIGNEWADESYQKVLDFAYAYVKPGRGLFLKNEKAIELVRQNPPVEIMRFLGYSDVEAMIQNENIFDIFSSLRFGENQQWLNTVFFKPYADLQPSDFEERDVQIRTLPQKYASLAQSFIKKKYHNLSHLKELGLLFIIPNAWHQAGQLMKITTLAVHYLYEISFYADIVKQYAADTDSFAQKLISLLRGDVLEPKIGLSSSDWLITQRYLEKEDPFEIGLMVAHVNPESVHWAKAQKTFSSVSPEFALWNDLDWVGWEYKDEAGQQNLVSFNLTDIAMSLADVDKKKYTYHQREALWNKLFASYYGEDVLEQKIKENIASGIIKL
ncbi:MAG: hypothetical protein COV41_01900 [Candidatus Brennerbacteria bacterium CG11_big_fil_rev_8_21_14_0_20_43_10]|uniref:Uncharacterized protein n=3 Tax=Candidatus Brenneribacteriota TaxID=1817902 RepID=A0A2M8C229_9BACT|nr:MAG: hypothetical protein AUJ43_00930 [Parcubacteria group bacterium CG1_02_44_31]PIP50360.1 MAG: hypothetical protein COX12_01810 [Candidatus Brennerbacteria bacterium CG23_combo_of_CG06-09_8_20_14_all_44_41]PIR26241.1 MAG: hypothetical protein COV41_01900 [Candidatus Brennerbacteria bacterium CG11_big_fil_rev_8_21_14_0_20_43_10]PIX29205.1 MAG: hypothetical protein COZ64_00720 [Candidatus Brennerbacteria bacterium CG_4_8_14_3_um_filter_43_14]PJA19307.1 MAG: hypothetical protein COX61_01590 